VDAGVTEWCKADWDQTGRRFLSPGESYLEVDLKPPTELFKYHEAIQAVVISELCEKGFSKTLALVLHEFLQWYGSTLTLDHADRGEKGCFFDMSLKFKREGRNCQIFLAQKFQPRYGNYVRHKIFIPKETFWESSELKLTITLSNGSESNYMLRSMKLSLSTEEESLELPRNFNDIWHA